MHKTVQILVSPDKGVERSLTNTLREFNAACNYTAQVAQEQNLTNRYTLHKACYKLIRKEFGLGAQATNQVLRKVLQSLKTAKKNKKKSSNPLFFRAMGAQPYDARNLSWRLDENEVSIWTVDGRKKHVPVIMTPTQKMLLSECQIGESDLVFRDGMLFLYATIEIPEPKLIEVSGYLGVDLGLKNIAVTSDGTTFKGDVVTATRKRHLELRAELQKKGTRSSRRKAKKRSGRESRYMRDVNHCISKWIVCEALRTGRAIVLERLDGIRVRVTVRKSQRYTIHSWSFSQLRSFIEYKATLVGVPVIVVDPRNTSRECPGCHHISKKNRRTRDDFQCVKCGLAGPADHIAAHNISHRGELVARGNSRYGGLVNDPNAPHTRKNTYGKTVGSSKPVPSRTGS